MMTEYVKFDSWIESCNEKGEVLKSPICSNVGMTKLTNDISSIVSHYSMTRNILYRALKPRNIVPLQESMSERNKLINDIRLFLGVVLGDFKYNIVIYYQRRTNNV